MERETVYNVTGNIECRTMNERQVVVFDDRIEDLAIEREIFGGIAVDLTLSGTTREHVLTDGTDAFGIIIDATVPIPADVISALDELEIVARSGVGFDNVDVDATRDRDIRVTNVPDYCLDEVSTHALSLILALVRNLPVYDRRTSDGSWDWTDGVAIKRLSEQTLGIVGYGNIGSRTARKAAPFFEERLAYDPYVADDTIRSDDVGPVGFEDLLARSDVISLHPPLTEETRGMIDASAFGKMNDETILVNTSRGEVVDQQALADALDQGTIAAAGLDVMEAEPPENDQLLARNDVLVTPHAAWYSNQSMVDLRRGAAREVKRTLEDEPPKHPVEEQEWA